MGGCEGDFSQTVKVLKCGTFTGGCEENKTNQLSVSQAQGCSLVVVTSQCSVLPPEFRKKVKMDQIMLIFTFHVTQFLFYFIKF